MPDTDTPTKPQSLSFGLALSAEPSTREKIELDLTDRMQLGMRLRQLRLNKGMTTLQVSEQFLGYQGSHAAVSRLERAVLPRIHRGHLEKLAKGFEVSYEDLIEGTTLSKLAQPPVLNKEFVREDIAEGVGARIRFARQALGWSVRTLSEKLEHASGDALVRDWENGAMAPRVDTLVDIASATGVSLSWLVLGKRGLRTQVTTGLRLRALRKAAGLSRPALAMKADPHTAVSLRNAIAGAEMGRKPLGPAALSKLAHAFDVPVDWLQPPQDGFSEPKGGSDMDEFTNQVNALPAPLRKFIKHLADHAANGHIDLQDAVLLSKRINERALKRISGKKLEPLSVN